MVFASTRMNSSLRPALNVSSKIFPDWISLNLVRTKAPPLPGFTCWNSITFMRLCLCMMTAPFRISDVVAMVLLN